MDSNKLSNACVGLALICMSFTAVAGSAESTPLKETLFDKKNIEVYLGLLYLQPNSNNLNYAVFVSGQQPLYQSWHYQAIDPKYSPGFELGGKYVFSDALYRASADWVHLNTRDASFKQASRDISLGAVEFVAPPFEQSPPVFAVKRANATVNFNFDSIELNVGRVFKPHTKVQANLYGGVNILRIKQNLTTIFSDLAGSEATLYSYLVPPDPSFSFQLQNVSDYVGAGPDLGLDVAYTVAHGFGVVGGLLGTLTAGNMRIQDKFTSTSARLAAIGIDISHQEITVPDTTQVVPGFDGKLGLFYNYYGKNLPKLNFEVGYRLAAYINALSTVNPTTLVQAGTFVVTPEFVTGTMAIVSSDVRDRTFNFNGPYIKLNVAMA